MQRIYSLSLLLALFVLLTASAPTTSKYQSKEAKLSVVFPAAFSTSDATVEGARSVKIMCEYDEGVYFVNYTIHTTELDNSADLTQVSVDSFIEGLSAQIEGSNQWKVGKNVGKKVTFKVSEGDLVGDYRVVLIGNIQYQITVVSPSANWNQKRVDAFMKSFKIK